MVAIFTMDLRNGRKETAAANTVVGYWSAPSLLLRNQKDDQNEDGIISKKSSGYLKEKGTVRISYTTVTTLLYIVIGLAI